jgi:hypothetical protein
LTTEPKVGGSSPPGCTLSRTDKSRAALFVGRTSPVSRAPWPVLAFCEVFPILSRTGEFLIAQKVAREGSIWTPDEVVWISEGSNGTSARFRTVARQPRRRTARVPSRRRSRPSRHRVRDRTVPQGGDGRFDLDRDSSRRATLRAARSGGWAKQNRLTHNTH